MTGLLGGANYSMNQASYDLARLRVNGLITRIPGRNRYRLTDDDLAFAIFYTKLHDRLLRPMLAADQPPAPPSIRKALRTIDIHITQRIQDASQCPSETKVRYAASGTAPGSGGPAGSFGSPGCAHRRGRRLGRWPTISAFATGTC